MRVLLVDDNDELRKALRFVLERGGYDVDEAQTGVEALQSASRCSYDAAIVDYQLPPPDGLEVLGQLRNLQPRCLRMLMSGALDLSAIITAVNRGEITRVLVKPFAGSRLLATLDEVVSARARFEELCVGARSDSFAAERRDLQDCLNDETLALALQPIVDASRGSVVGYEALLRSRHPSFSNPLAIIAAGETHHMLDLIGDRVAQCVARWLPLLPPDKLLFFNVHPQELARREDVARRFEPLRPWSERIVVEITERSQVLQIAGWNDTLDYLTTAGFRIAVDDLGSGYNSLSILAELQPAFMKIDMSIVRNIDREVRKQRLVGLLSRFAKVTRSRLVVEGIETEEESATVKRLGAELLQGYLLGRPALTLAPAPT